MSLPLGVSFGIKKGDFLFSTGGEPKAERSLDKFSLPLYRRRNDHDFFFLGDDDELVTGAVTGARVYQVLDRVYSLVLGMCGRSDGRSESWRALPPQ